ncbi:MAG: xanthine dehydrogenase family protein subunit M, partial [Chloroflexi bacterium]
DISMVNAAATLKIQGGTITRARLVLGAVAPVPLRVTRAEEVLAGKLATEETFQRAAELVRDEVRPITDHRATAAYRRKMSSVTAVRALRQAAGLAPQGEEWRHA